MPRLPLCTRTASTLLILCIASVGFYGCADTSVFVFDQEVVPGPDQPFQGVVRIGTASPLTDWDPMVPAGWHIATSLQHASLLRRDLQMKAFVGELATHFVHNRSRGQLEIELGESIFHDGSPVTAADVLYSFQRAREATSRGSLRAFAAWIGPGALTSRGEKEIQVSIPPGECSLELVLAGLANLPVVPRSGLGFGAGPYRLDGFDRESALLVAVDRKMLSGGQVAEILIYGDLSAASRRQRLLSGRIDVAILPGTAWPTPRERRDFIAAIQRGTRLLVMARHSSNDHDAHDTRAIEEAFAGRLRRLELVPASPSADWPEQLVWPDPNRSSLGEEELQIAREALDGSNALAVPVRGAGHWAERALAWADVPAIGIAEHWVQIVRSLEVKTPEACINELERNLSESLKLRGDGHQVEWLALAREGVGGLERMRAHLREAGATTRGIDEIELMGLLR